MHVARPAVRPATCNLGNHHGTGEIVPFVNRTFQWGVAVAIFLSVLSIVPRHCAALTYFVHSKLRNISAVLITPQLMTLTLRCAESFATAKGRLNFSEKDCCEAPLLAALLGDPNCMCFRKSWTRRLIQNARQNTAFFCRIFLYFPMAAVSPHFLCWWASIPPSPFPPRVYPPTVHLGLKAMIETQADVFKIPPTVRPHEQYQRPAPRGHASS